MSEELKKQVIDSVKKQCPNANEERIRTLLGLVLLEIESYNTCGKKIDYQKLQELVTEVVYQLVKNELEKTISSVRRGDTTISYATSHAEIQNLLGNYTSMLKRLIGCGNVGVF